MPVDDTPRLAIHLMVDSSRKETNCGNISKPCANLTDAIAGQRFCTILADPPWRFENRHGKGAPEHKRLGRYETMDLQEVRALPVAEIAAEPAHLYLWVPNTLLPEGIEVMRAWGFNYKTTLTWRKPEGRRQRRTRNGLLLPQRHRAILFGVRGKNARTLKPGRTQVNYLESRKRETHLAGRSTRSSKPAAPAPTSSFSREVAARVGPRGETRRTVMCPPGRPTRTTLRRSAMKKSWEAMKRELARLFPSHKPQL